MTFSSPDEAVLSSWREALGDENVIDDPEVLARYGRTTQPTAPQPSAVVRPAAVEEVQHVVREAAKHGTPLYPISGGKNWGYGDACPTTDGAVIVDLGRMNQIHEVDSRLAFAVVEPGVTQQQLYEYLQAHYPDLWLDCSGAGTDASVVGNALDRGFGHTPYGDHFRSMCGIEAVLGDGTVVNTGFTHIEGARATRAYAYGVGPILDGLFSQSNLGIVTKMGVWLMPRPETFEAFFLRVAQDEDLSRVIEALRPLRLAGVLESAVHIANDLRVISGAGRYPWDGADGETPLPESVREQLRTDWGIGPWNLSGSLAGTKGHVRASRAAVRRALSQFGTLRFVHDSRLALGKRVVHLMNRFGLGRGLKRTLTVLEPNYGLLKGIPTNEPLLGAQWRLRQPPDGPCDPLDCGCGLMWISPVLPMTGEDATRVRELAEPIFKDHAFEFLATFTLINKRAIIGILNVVFDKGDEDQCEQAEACYDALTKALHEAGYPPYRCGLRGMANLNTGSDTFWETATRIKKALDPEGIISPGRYIPR